MLIFLGPFKVFLELFSHFDPGVLTLTWYTYLCACLLGCYFAKFDTAISGFSSEMKEPKLYKLGVF